MSECGVRISQEYPEVTKQEAEDLLLRQLNRIREKAAKNGGNIEKAKEEVTEEFIQRDKFNAALRKRQAYLAAEKEMDFTDYAKKFVDAGATLMDGIKSKLVGTALAIQEARYSIGSQMKALNEGYFGRMVQEMEEANIFRDFYKNNLTRQIYIEMGEIKPDGKPGISGSPAAQKIAAILDKITKEMNYRLNQAGTAIADVPGYVLRQTHDMIKIRRAGENKEQSRNAWINFTLPLIDSEKTFLGADKLKWMLNMHDALYSGVTGVMGEAGQGVGHRAIADRWQKERVLHFKDAESAWKYNEKFGLRDFKQQVMIDIGNRARSIALMENLGPNPEAALLNSVRLLKEWARTRDDSAKQIDSINDTKIMQMYEQLTGVNDIPENPTMTQVVSDVKAIAQMSKMGAVAVTNLFTDGAFQHVGLAYHGISHLNTLGMQLTQFAKKTGDEKATLRLMGAGLDGLLGNALSRYSSTGPISGPINTFQKKFFDINFSNLVTDSGKAGAARLLATNLGNHAHLPFGDLPKDLSRVLSLYDIGAKEWNLMRETAYDHPSGNWGKMITADQLKNLSDARIASLYEGEGEPTAKALRKLRDTLETKLRTYIADSIDYTSPTPGHAERLIATQGTKAGTAMGEAVRLLMLFKSFPITVANKIIAREVYGRGSMSAKQWLLNDHQGKFNLATLIAMTTAAGYIGMVIRDALRGRTPRELITDGKINLDVLQDSAVQGGGLGIMGEMITRDYGHGMGSFLEGAAGPILGQLDKLAEVKTKASEGEPVGAQLGKLAIDNTPLLNLFYIRPILNYYVLWNLQEMLDPGSLKRTERSVEEKNNQGFFVKPSETVNQ